VFYNLVMTVYYKVAKGILGLRYRIVCTSDQKRLKGKAYTITLWKRLKQNIIKLAFAWIDDRNEHIFICQEIKVSTT